MKAITIVMFTLLAVSSAEARRGQVYAPECNVTMPCDIAQNASHRSSRMPIALSKAHQRADQVRLAPAGRVWVVDHEDIASGASRIVSHPAGCPRTAFCACGVAVRVFGEPRRDLWLAASWLRFPHVPSSMATPGMVAARSGHAFYIEQVLAPGIVLAYDANSGGHMTRIHPRSLAGYTVVNPR